MTGQSTQHRFVFVIDLIWSYNILLEVSSSSNTYFYSFTLCSGIHRLVCFAFVSSDIFTTCWKRKACTIMSKRSKTITLNDKYDSLTLIGCLPSACHNPWIGIPKRVMNHMRSSVCADFTATVIIKRASVCQSVRKNQLAIRHAKLY